MEAKKSVVTLVKYLEGNDYTGDYGTYYKFQVDFENGDSGEYSAKDKDNPKFVVGQEQSYQVDLTYPKYPKIKFYNSEYQEKFKRAVTNPYKPNDKMSKEDWDNTNLKKQISISRQSALKGAIDFCRNQDCPPEQVLEQATMFHHWQMTGEVLEVPEMPFEKPF